MVSEPQQGKRRHKLLTAEIRQALPAIGSTDGQGLDAVAQVKFFSPYSSRGTWYFTEFDGEDLLYGYGGFSSDREWGYSSFREMAEVTYASCVPAIERDCHWDPRPVRECVT
jgi:hypothetical protein